MAATWDLSKWQPRMTAAGGTMTVSNMVYNTMTMFEVGPDADPLTPPIVPRLAETWDFNDDATRLTYHLHQGMHWGDIDDPTQPGPEIVAADIAWVFDQYQNSSVHSGALFLLIVLRHRISTLSWSIVHNLPSGSCPR